MNVRYYIQVILPLKLDWEPYYFCENSTPPQKGEIVKVLFAGKSYFGVISKTGKTHPDKKFKINEAEIIRGLPAISEKEMELWDFLASYYMCTTGEVYQAAYGLTEASVNLQSVLHKEKLRKEKKQNQFLEQIARIEAAIKKAEQELQELSVHASSCSDKNEKRITSIFEKTNALNLKTEKLGEKLKQQKSKLEKLFQDTTPAPYLCDIPDLSNPQQRCVGEIQNHFEKKRTVLLEGASGSGKTEIYMNLAQKTLSEGKSVLYLVPEILLGEHISERIKKYFGSIFFTVTSNTTFSRRAKIAHEMKKGNYVMLGTKISILMPHYNLGLIIVDEEHDISYKQDMSDPKYNARDIAVFLGRLHDARVLLGSSTPSLETYFNCITGKYAMCELKEKYYESLPAKIELINTSAERKKNGMPGIFAYKTINQMKTALDDGEQIIILNARRAYSMSVQCSECGFVVKCPKCNIPMRFHKPENKLMCHHCNFTEIHSGKCKQCGGKISYMGAGTQKVEEEIKKIFPDKISERIDGDIMHKKRLSETIMADFASGKTNILIGTSIISKGLDFPRLNTSVAVHADSMLGAEDFRADERTIQTLLQLCGRCSRRDKRGKFIIQTSRPDHPVYSMLTDYRKFCHVALMERQEFGYPPFSREILIKIKDSSEKRAEMMGNMLHSEVSKIYSPVEEENDKIQITNLHSPEISKKNNMFIKHIRIYLPRFSNCKNMKEIIFKTIKDFEKNMKYPSHIDIDVDPV